MLGRWCCESRGRSSATRCSPPAISALFPGAVDRSWQVVASSLTVAPDYPGTTIASGRDLIRRQRRPAGVQLKICGVASAAPGCIVRTHFLPGQTRSSAGLDCLVHGHGEFCHASVAKKGLSSAFLTIPVSHPIIRPRCK